MIGIYARLETIAIVASSTAMIVGCSITHEQVARMNNFDLCEVTYARAYTSDAKSAAADELKSCGADCRDAYVILDRQAAGAAAFIQSQQQYNIRQQEIDAQRNSELIRSMQNNRQTHCNSYFYGNSMQTNCY